MSRLAQSYRDVLKRIETTGGIWMRTSKGWCHTYNRVTVLMRKAEIESEIDRLEKK